MHRTLPSAQSGSAIGRLESSLPTSCLVPLARVNVDASRRRPRLPLAHRATSASASRRPLGLPEHFQSRFSGVHKTCDTKVNWLREPVKSPAARRRRDYTARLAAHRGLRSPVRCRQRERRSPSDKRGVGRPNPTWPLDLISAHPPRHPGSRSPEQGAAALNDVRGPPARPAEAERRCRVAAPRKRPHEQEAGARLALFG